MTSRVLAPYVSCVLVTLLVACKPDTPPAAATHDEPTAVPAQHEGAEPMTSETPGGGSADAKRALPTCTNAATLGTLDGQRIELVGVYRKSLTARKMGGPRTFRGEAHLEIDGSPADYDPKGSSEGLAIVRLGVRPPAEVEQLVGRRVRAEGVLVLDPYREVREARVDYATVISGPPRLNDVGEVHPVDGD